ncbi:hypothetical protein LZ31DRAFT_561592 [Colletotrichum somersetense]|nr:hypothetical protein LZ31DRAFT_561592 [Colletotrichum somersetense]
MEESTIVVWNEKEIPVQEQPVQNQPIILASQKSSQDNRCWDIIYKVPTDEDIKTMSLPRAFIDLSEVHTKRTGLVRCIKK